MATAAALLLAACVLASAVGAAGQATPQSLTAQSTTSTSSPTQVYQPTGSFYVQLSSTMMQPMLTIDPKTSGNSGNVYIRHNYAATPTVFDSSHSLYGAKTSWTLPAGQNLLYFDVVMQGTFSIQVTYTPITSLSIGDSATGPSTSDYSTQSYYYSVDVPADTSGVTVKVTLQNWVYDLTVYVAQGAPANTGTASSLPDNDDQINDHYYKGPLVAGQTNYITVQSAYAFTIEIDKALISSGAVVGIIIGVVAAIAVVCVIVGCKTHARDINTDTRMRHVMWSQTLFITIVAGLAPTIIFIVGLAVWKVIGPIFIGVGGGIVAVVLLCAGPRAFDMNAATGKFVISKYWAFVFPRHQAYNIADIGHFGMVTSRGSKGQTLYAMKMYMKNGTIVPLEMGASNVAVDGRQNLITKLNAFVSKLNGGAAHQQPQHPVGGVYSQVNPAGAAAMAALPQAVPVQPMYAGAGGGYGPGPGYPPAGPGYPMPPQQGYAAPQQGYGGQPMLTPEQQAMLAQQQAMYMQQQQMYMQQQMQMQMQMQEQPPATAPAYNGKVDAPAPAYDQFTQPQPHPAPHHHSGAPASDFNANIL